MTGTAQEPPARLSFLPQRAPLRTELIPLLPNLKGGLKQRGVGAGLLGSSNHVTKKLPMGPADVPLRLLMSL